VSEKALNLLIKYFESFVGSISLFFMLEKDENFCDLTYKNELITIKVDKWI
jgi:hypothetical protein